MHCHSILQYDIQKFYYLARTCLAKDEELIDRFDTLLHNISIQSKIGLSDVLKNLEIPKEWIEKLLERQLTEDEVKKIKKIRRF